MTHISIHPAEQTSRFNSYVVGALMASVLALSVVMLFGQFVA